MFEKHLLNTINRLHKLHHKIKIILSLQDESVVTSTKKKPKNEYEGKQINKYYHSCFV